MPRTPKPPEEPLKLTSVSASVKAYLTELAGRDQELANGPLAMTAVRLALEMDSQAVASSAKGTLARELRETLDELRKRARKSEAMSATAAPVAHERCAAKTKRGAYCKLPAGHGTAHVGIGRCKLHGGATPNHERGAQLQLAREACARLHIPHEGIRPDVAMLKGLEHAYGEMEFLRDEVAKLPTHPEPDQYVGETGEGRWQRGQPGIYGRIYHISGVPSGETRTHVLVDLYHQAWERVIDIASTMLRLKLEERGVRLAEREGAALFGAIERTFAKLGLSDFERFHTTLADELHEELVALPAGERS